jgi:hypothetical protein
MPRMPIRLALAAATGLLLSACAASGPVELTEQQACLEHNKNDPAARDRCYQSPDLRRGSPPDARPEDLPVRSGQVSD